MENLPNVDMESNRPRLCFRGYYAWGGEHMNTYGIFKATIHHRQYLSAVAFRCATQGDNFPLRGTTQPPQPTENPMTDLDTNTNIIVENLDKSPIPLNRDDAMDDMLKNKIEVRVSRHPNTRYHDRQDLVSYVTKHRNSVHIQEYTFYPLFKFEAAAEYQRIAPDDYEDTKKIANELETYLLSEWEAFLSSPGNDTESSIRKLDRKIY